MLRLALPIAVALLLFVEIPWSQVSRSASTMTVPIPRITGISPTTGTWDTAVTISTTGIQGVTIKEVDFGGVPGNFSGAVPANQQIVSYTPYYSNQIQPGTDVSVTMTLSDGTILVSPVPFSFVIGEMSVTGPRLYDPQAIGDPLWTRGDGHYLQFRVSSTLSVGTATPVFHVTTSFSDDSDVHPESLQAPFALGNQGQFSLDLQMCDATALPTGQNGNCSDSSGNPGLWVEATSAPGKLTLNSPGNSNTGFGDLSVQVAQNVFDQLHLVRTFRFLATLSLTDTNNAMANNTWADATYSNPFNVIASPALMLQIKVVPYQLVYAPPGDESTGTFTTKQTILTNFTVGTSTDVSTKVTTQESYSAKLSATVGYNVSFGEQWDTTTSYGVATTNSDTNMSMSSVTLGAAVKFLADSTLIPGSGETCLSSSNCAQLNPPPTRPFQPWIHDTFTLLIHPQIAIWELGSGPTRSVMIAAVPVTAQIDVATLEACASGTPPVGNINACEIDYAESLPSPSGGGVAYMGTPGTVFLTPSEATNILLLDPFYLARSQNPNLPSTRIISIGSTSYGAKAGEAVQAEVDRDYVNQSQTNTMAGSQVAYSASVTSTLQFPWTLAFNYNYSSALGTSESVSFPVDKTTTEWDTKVTYSDSQAVTVTNSVEYLVTLQDYDNTMKGGGSFLCSNCHGPLPRQPAVFIFLDRQFSGFLFQDPNAVRQTGPGGVAAPSVVDFYSELAQGEQSKQRFADVPAANSGYAAIGVLSRAGIVTGYPNGTFQPDAPITRAQLAIALAKGMNMTSGPGRTNFTDVSSTDNAASSIAAVTRAGLMQGASATQFEPNSGVTRQELAQTISRMLKLTSTAPLNVKDSSQISPAALSAVRAVLAGGILNSFPDGTFRPTATVTRAEAAQALFSALTSRHPIAASRLTLAHTQ